MNEQTMRDILKNYRRIAVVGMSGKPDRPGHRIPMYLKGQGYDIVPVNPMEKEIAGMPCYPDLRSLPQPPEVVLVFRRSEDTPPIAAEAVAVGAKALWLQSGIVNEEAAATARDGGLQVVMDACMMVEHARLHSMGKV